MDISATTNPPPAAAELRVPLSESGVASIGVLIDEHLMRHDPMLERKPGFLARLTAVAAKSARQEMPVRGNTIAAETIIDALISEGRMNQWLIVYPSAEVAVSERLTHRHSITGPRQRVGISLLEDVIRTGIDKHHLTAWFNPIPRCAINGGIEISQSIRNSSSTPYPITTLFHGLSKHSMLHDDFLRLVLGGALACDSIICTSRAGCQAIRKILDFLRERIEKDLKTVAKYNGRIDLVPLAVDTSEYRPRDKSNARSELKIPKDAFLMIYLGRISPHKADLLPSLMMFQKLVDDNPTRKLLWVVAGTEQKGYEQFLQQRARDMGLSGHFRVMRGISNYTKKLLLSAADVFVCPSDSVEETFGLAPVEALASGVPQVVPDWDGFRDTVVHQLTGYLVPTFWAGCDRDLSIAGDLGDMDFNHLCLGQSVAIDLSKARLYLQSLIENEQLRKQMGIRSRERALSLYSYASVVRRYEELWIELAAIASGLANSQSVLTSERPLYHRFFGHYASVTLSDTTTVRLTPLGRDFQLAKGGNKSFSVAPTILSHAILRRAIQEIAGHSASGPSYAQNLLDNDNCYCSIGELIDTLRKSSNLHRDHLLRHILWLMKYGVLEPVIVQNKHRC